ncbi:flippase-like domain-containing protein [bacterium]|nr:flippase-like domain-containing protein [bacterium]
MIKRTFFFLLFLVTGILLFLSVLFNTGLDSIGKSLSTFSLANFIIFLVLSLLNFALFTLRWHIILRHQDKKHKVPFYRLFLHRMAAYAVSYLTPAATTGGEPVRIFFLQEEGVEAKAAISSTVIDKVFEYTALILFIFSGIIASIIEGSIFSGKAELMLIGFLIFFGGIIFWFYYATMKHIGFFSSILKFLRLNKLKWIKKNEKTIAHIEKQMAKFYTQNAKRFIFLLFISFCTVFFMVLEHFLIALFLGVKLTFLQSFISATIPGISYIIPVPGALGMLEGSHAGIFALLGVSINVFVFVLIIRIRDLVFISIGLAHASRHGIRMIYRSTRGKNKQRTYKT